MTLDVQFKLKGNPNYINYLRQNSYWYKILNRNPDLINEMVKEMKDRYKLNTGDKIERIGEKLSMIDTILKVIE